MDRFGWFLQRWQGTEPGSWFLNSVHIRLGEWGGGGGVCVLLCLANISKAFLHLSGSLFASWFPIISVRSSADLIHPQTATHGWIVQPVTVLGCTFSSPALPFCPHLIFSAVHYYLSSHHLCSVICPSAHASLCSPFNPLATVNFYFNSFSLTLSCRKSLRLPPV